MAGHGWMLRDLALSRQTVLALSYVGFPAILLPDCNLCPKYVSILITCALGAITVEYDILLRGFLLN